MTVSDVAIAIDVGGTKTLVGIITSEGQIVAQRRIPTVAADGPEVHMERCAALARECLAEAGVASPLGVGVSVPGLADSRTGTLIYGSATGWKDVPIQGLLQPFWPDLPIAIANDVNACALGELVFGGGRDFQNFLWVTISTGVGGGLIIERKIFEGEQGISGEVGHMVVEWERPRLCPCGTLGCLEAHSSGTAIRLLAEELVADEQAGAELAAYLRERGLEVTPEHVATAARDGVASAREIYRSAGMYLGRAFSAVVNLLNPGAIFIGGGAGRALDLFMPTLEPTLRAAVIGDTNKVIPILPTSLGYEAALIGAAGLIFQARLEPRGA